MDRNDTCKYLNIFASTIINLKLKKMITTKEISGFYGSNNTPCTVFVLNDTYMNWYVVEGSVNINATYEDLEDGVNVEELSDVDIITSAKPILSLEQLEKEVTE